MKKSIMGIIVCLLLVGIVGFFLYRNPPKQEENSKKVETEKKIIEEMTIEEKVGQLFLVRYDSSLVESYNSKNPGGYILFAKDFENHTKESIKKELDNIQKISKYPLIIGVDEEGGYVTRVSRFPAFRKEKFASPKYYFETGGYELLEEMEKEKAELLTSLGINFNLAPVADVSTSEEDFIYSRSFGRNAEETADFIKHMVTYANENHISSCLKHFPGYGNNQDTHTGIAIDNRSYDNFVKNDFLPFEAGIKAGVPAILVSHNVVTSIDDQYPASLSEKVIKELRNTLHFNGIIMTDDLEMDAVKSYVENKEAATLAIKAGNDMIITSNFPSMYEEVIKAVKEKRISEETINKAVERILQWKQNSKLF